MEFDMKTEKKNCDSRITRRKFLAAATSITAFTIVPRHVLGGPGQTPPSEKLNIACIGVGGKGYDNVRNVSTENIVALCDVDKERGAAAFEMFPDAKRYSDYRRMLDREGKSIDAVVVTTPDHVHIPASVMAMQMGKPATARNRWATTSMKSDWPPRWPGKTRWPRRWGLGITAATASAGSSS